MQIGIKHQNGDLAFPRGTLVVHLPNKQTLLDFPSLCVEFMELDCGISFCHKKDQFNKKTGLALALARLHSGTFYLKSIENRFGRYVYHLISDVSTDSRIYSIELGISLINSSKHVRLEYAVIGD